MPPSFQWQQFSNLSNKDSWKILYQTEKKKDDKKAFSGDMEDSNNYNSFFRLGFFAWCYSVIMDYLMQKLSL